jgi:hypothetical protein
MTTKISENTVKSAPIPESGSSSYWDDEITGFGFRVHSKGTRSFFLNYRISGRQKQITIGRYPTWTALRARIEAKRLRREVDAGRDPAQERREAKRAAMFAAGVPMAIIQGGDSFEDRRYRTVINAQLLAAEKFRSFIEYGIEPACYLYRHYHPNGDLLYVGISLRALNRQQAHAAEANRRNLIHRIVMEPFETREEALAAEEAAIRLEFPKFNKVHNAHHKLPREIARLRSEASP